MSFRKNWTSTGDKEIVRVDSVQRCKPGIGSNDRLDEINEQYAEHQRAEHETGHCGGLDDHCPHCEADRNAELEAKHYQGHVFDRLQYDLNWALDVIQHGKLPGKKGIR